MKKKDELFTNFSVFFALLTSLGAGSWRFSVTASVCTGFSAAFFGYSCFVECFSLETSEQVAVLFRCVILSRC